jgi:hypothetical protein
MEIPIGWQPQPIMALWAILRLTELFAAGIKKMSKVTFKGSCWLKKYNETEY